jgi:hypothetical protein
MPKILLSASVICAVTSIGWSAIAGGSGRPQAAPGLPTPLPQTQAPITYGGSGQGAGYGGPQAQGPSSYSYAYGSPSSQGTQPTTQIYGNGFTTPQGLSAYSYSHSTPQGSTLPAQTNLQGSSFSLSPSGGVSYSYTSPQGSSGYSYNPPGSGYPPPSYQQPAYQPGANWASHSAESYRDYPHPNDGEARQHQYEGGGVSYGSARGSVGTPRVSNDILETPANILSGD